MTTIQNAVGCVAKFGYGNAHQLQLWITGGSGWNWVLRNAYVPGGKHVRSCVLDNGSNPDYDETRRLGQEAFDRVKAEEVAKSLQSATAGGVTDAALASTL